MSRKRVAPTAGDEVYESLRECLRRSEAGPGPWTSPAGDGAIEQIASAVEEVLRHRLSELDVQDVVGWAASAMAVAVDERHRARTTPRQNLAMAKVAQTHTENSIAGQIVLELAARQQMEQGRRLPTRRDLEALAILAHELWQWRTVADRVAVGLVTITNARLTRRGTFDVKVTDRTPLRWSRYEAASLRRLADFGPGRGQDDVALFEAIIESMKAGADLPEELREVDQALITDRGHSLVDLLVVLELLIILAGDTDDSVSGYLVRGGVEGLDHTVGDNFLQLAPHGNLEGGRAAVRRLVWTQDLLQRTRLRLSDFRESLARLYSRPILELSDGSLFVPRNAAGLARVVLIQRMIEGTWPEELGAEDQALARALDRRRQHIRPILGFEAELERTLAATGLPYVVHVGSSPPGRPSTLLGIPVRAEIDAVVVAHETHTIWVVEAKDLAIPIAPRRVRSELDKYLRPVGHVAKLDSKVADVAISQSVVARRLGYTGDVTGFTVRGLFVTREVAVAAFVDGVAHEFVTIDRLSRLLTTDE